VRVSDKVEGDGCTTIAFILVPIYHHLAPSSVYRNKVGRGT